MSKIRDAFRKSLAGNAGECSKAFIPFITCGDPDLETTEQLVYAMAEAGADIIELGIPFSDPTAEGPTIQAANLRALSGGVKTEDVFRLVERIREHCDIPLAFMTYANVVFSYDGGVPAGPASAEHAGGQTLRFIRRMREVGVDGLILPDVPFEEKDEFAVPCREEGIDFISLIAPTSHERIRKAAADADGFLYCVSSLGVTGTRDAITTDIGGMVRLAKEAAPELPCAVGFGISNPEQAAEMAALSDGAIVGSAIVKLCAEYGRDCVKPVADYVRAMAAAAHQAG